MADFRKRESVYGRFPEISDPRLERSLSGTLVLWPVQIVTRGTIQESTVHADLLELHATTSHGSWDLQAFLRGQIPAEVLRDFLEQAKHWKRPGRSVLISRSTMLDRNTADPSLTAKLLPADIDMPLRDWQSSGDEILAKLSDPEISREERFAAILFAEVAKFDPSQAEQLIGQLFQFINKYRLSQDDETKTVVGAAIRKLALHLRDPQIDDYADLFRPTETDTLPCEVELELAKAILWRLMLPAPTIGLQFPNLEGRLVELASDYLTPRLILQKNFSSITLHALIVLLILRSRSADGLLRKVHDLKVEWFSDLLRRRVKRVRDKLLQYDLTSSRDAVATLDRSMAVLTPR